MAWEKTSKVVAGAVVIVCSWRSCSSKAFRIPSGENEIPTLLIGDWLFVTRLASGPTIPYTTRAQPGAQQHEKHKRTSVVFGSPYQADEAERGADPTPTLVKGLIGICPATRSTFAAKASFT